MTRGASRESNDPAREPFVSRAGRKLAHALDVFDLDVTGWQCADLGCNVGGFTDCLLQRGASLVYAVDTGYGTLAYTLRRDERVVVMERTNALHVTPPPGGVDLVTIDLGWTPQRHAIPAALRWLKPGGHVVSLVKPHYERSSTTENARGPLTDEEAEQVMLRVLTGLPALGLDVHGHTQSPVRGKKGGNAEYLVVGVRRE